MKNTINHIKGDPVITKKTISANGAGALPVTFEFSELTIIKELLSNCTVKGKDSMMIALMINKTDDLIQMADKGTIKRMDAPLGTDQNILKESP